MRTIRNQPIPQDGNNVLFPDGQVRNETETETGTPVVREIYGDIHTNIYAILRDAGIAPNESEDSTVNGHQLLDALKVFSNKLNDISQLLTVNGNEVSIDVNFDSLPLNYVFIGQVSDSLLSSENYTISGNGIKSFSINAVNDILASSFVLLVLNEAGSKIFSLTQNNTQEDQTVNTSFGTPIGFNESKEVLYMSSGSVINNEPSSFDIQSSIRAFEASGDWNLLECVAHKGKLICIAQKESNSSYKIYSFSLLSLDTIEGSINFPLSSLTDNMPYIFCDGDYVYFSNTAATVNDSSENYKVGKFLFNELDLSLTFVSSFELNLDFEKTTNSFIDKENSFFYTFINSQLVRYSIGSGTKIVVGFFNTINGNVFKLNGSTYYSNGNIATKWKY